MAGSFDLRCNEIYFMLHQLSIFGHTDASASTIRFSARSPAIHDVFNGERDFLLHSAASTRTFILGSSTEKRCARLCGGWCSASVQQRCLALDAVALVSLWTVVYVERWDNFILIRQPLILISICRLLILIAK